MKNLGNDGLDEHNMLHIIKEARWRCATKNEPAQTYLRKMLLKDLPCLSSNDS